MSYTTQLFLGTSRKIDLQVSRSRHVIIMSNALDQLRTVPLEPPESDPTKAFPDDLLEEKRDPRDLPASERSEDGKVLRDVTYQ